MAQRCDTKSNGNVLTIFAEIDWICTTTCTPDGFVIFYITSAHNGQNIQNSSSRAVCISIVFQFLLYVDGRRQLFGECCGFWLSTHWAELAKSRSFNLHATPSLETKVKLLITYCYEASITIYYQFLENLFVRFLAILSTLANKIVDSIHDT